MGQVVAKEVPNPCVQQMNAYLACVESHTNGLSENDDCAKEVLDYKKCRAQIKETEKNSGS